MDHSNHRLFTMKTNSRSSLPVWGFGLATSMLVIATCGCDSKPQPAINKPVPAAALRVVNLTNETLTYRVNEWPPIDLPPESEGRFENVRPDREAIVDFPGLGEKRPVSIGSKEAVTFFVRRNDQATEIVLVKDEPKAGSPSSVLVRVVSLLAGQDVPVRIGDSTVDPNQGTEILSIRRGRAEIRAGSSSQHHDFDLGEAYTLVVYGDPKQPTLKLIRNNPDDMAAFSPAGAASP